MARLRRRRRSKVVLTDQLGRETVMEVEHGKDAKVAYEWDDRGKKHTVRWTFRIEDATKRSPKRGGYQGSAPSRPLRVPEGPGI